MATKPFIWNEGVPRKHEKLATELMRKFATVGSRLSQQTAFVSVELRVDITMDGADVRYNLPPQLARIAADYQLLMELESSTLGLFKFRRMCTTLLNAYARYLQEHRSGKPLNQRTFPKLPMLIVYARTLSRALLGILKPTNEKGVYYFPLFNLHVYLIDNARTPSDSGYNHLGLLYAPEAATTEEFEAIVLEQYRQVIQYSSIPIRELEGIVMTSTQQLFTDIEKREEMRFTSFVDAYDKGVLKGVRKGERTGVRKGEQNEKRKAARIHRQGIQELARRRGISLTDNSLARLIACEDLEQLMQWTVQIGTAEGPIVELD